jgi:hypothetical protein
MMAVSRASADVSGEVARRTLRNGGREGGAMVTYEDVTEMFLNAAEETGLSVHPEFWMNTQTLEREFACTLHPGPCQDAEQRASCTLSFAWGPLDTVLSIDGAEGICDFFHEPDEDCPHNHTENVPPLILDLSYSLPMDRINLGSIDLRLLARTIKLRASEHSSRAVETRSNIALGLGESDMEAEALTLQQRVELPLWDPEGVSGFQASADQREGHMTLGRVRRRGQQTDGPHPEDWLPHLFNEVVEDISQVLQSLESTGSFGYPSSAHDTNAEN